MMVSVNTVKTGISKTFKTHNILTDNQNIQLTDGWRLILLGYRFCKVE